jgi:hypothetical protein
MEHLSLVVDTDNIHKNVIDRNVSASIASKQQANQIRLNNYSSSKFSSSDMIANTSSSSNSLTFTDDDEASSSSSSVPHNHTDSVSEINNDIIPPVSQQKVYSILRVAAPILPIRSNQNSSGSSSSSSSTSSSCGIEKKETITKASNIFNIANSEGTLANTNSSTKTKFVFILNAFVNGFAQLKICADKIDYEYIIEIYWSNEDRSFVKRTFDDFVIFHRNLLQSFSQFFSEISTNQNHSNNSIINNRNSNRNSRLFFNNFEEYLMPILPG